MSAAVLRYTLIVRHPDTDAPTALLAGKSVPDWATDLVHEDDLDAGKSTSEDIDQTAAKESADKEAADRAAAEKAAADAAGHPVGEPSTSWKVGELEAYAVTKNVDLSEAKNNGERVKLLADAAAADN